MRAGYLLFLILFSCGSFQRLGIQATSPILKDAADLSLQERNWSFFQESMPSNLKLMELLYLQDTKNDVLLSTLIKGFAGYAFGVSETLALEEEYSGSSEQLQRKNAIDFYTRSFDYGLEYLKRRHISSKDLLSLSEKKLHKSFSKHIDETSYQALLYTAQAWGSLINLQKDNMVLVSQVPRVKMIFDWICKKDPNIENGVCDLFFAQYEASRPKMLGGDPAKSKTLFEKAIKNYPQNLLMRMGQLQFLILPTLDKDLYESEASILKAELEQWSDLNRDELVKKSSYKDDLNLFNAIAKKRFEIIEKYKSKIF